MNRESEYSSNSRDSMTKQLSLNLSKKETAEGLYLSGYKELEDQAFERPNSVSLICKVNRLVSSVSVHDADERRKKDKNWRPRTCSNPEFLRLMIGNTIAIKALEASDFIPFDQFFDKAGARMTHIFNLLEEDI